MNKSLKKIKGEEDTLKLFFSKTIKLISLDICQAPPGSLLLHGENMKHFVQRLETLLLKKTYFWCIPHQRILLKERENRMIQIIY